MEMKILELFCGTKSISKVFKEKGHEVLTIDNNPSHKPDICIDILKLNKLKFKPDIIWASPPCQTFSMAGNGNNYTNFMPNNVNAALGLAYVLKTIEIIKELKPKYWFIENPMGYLRKFPFMLKFHRNTVTYCQYGDKRMKPTDIWTNCSAWIPKKRCKNKDNCHEAAPRGSKTGTQGLANDIERGVIPKELCEEIEKICHNAKEMPKQATLNGL